MTINRRNLLGVIGAGAAAPTADAVKRAAAGFHGSEAMMALHGRLGDTEDGYVGPRDELAERIGKAAANLLRRRLDEQRNAARLRRMAAAMPCDPDIAALRSCSEVYRHHLMLERLRAEMEADKELEWQVWPPSWMQP